MEIMLFCHIYPEVAYKLFSLFTQTFVPAIPGLQLPVTSRWPLHAASVLTLQSFPPSGWAPHPSLQKPFSCRTSTGLVAPSRGPLWPLPPLAPARWLSCPVYCRWTLPLLPTSPQSHAGGSWFRPSGPKDPRSPGPGLTTRCLRSNWNVLFPHCLPLKMAVSPS